MMAVAAVQNSGEAKMGFVAVRTLDLGQGSE